jgi:molybdenum-dependent oxidoreductase-like protein
MTLDGVMQAPGEPDEIKNGGWMIPYTSEEMLKHTFDELNSIDALLLGCVSYQLLAAVWPTLTALPIPFEGYQQAVAYRYSQSLDEPGEPVSLMQVRSLLIPPGIPDFLTRLRIVQRGSVELRGRAWSGRATITRVEVSCDGGTSWRPAQVGEPQGAYSWQPWRYLWEVSTPGTYELCCRAYDSAGNVQPLEQHWTAQGMGNNVAQRIPVVVV